MADIIKIAILINFLLLVIALFSGLFFVYQEQGQGNKTFIALSVRVGLAMSLMALLIFALAKGYVAPHAPWDNWQPADAASEAPRS